MAKPKLHPLDNKLHSELFFLVLEGKNYAQLISKIQEKTPAIVIRQINELLQLGLLQKKKEARLNKTIYSIDWQKVFLTIFFIYDNQQKALKGAYKHLKKEFNQSNKGMSALFINTVKSFMVFGQKAIITEFIDNKEVLSFIKSFFIAYNNITKEPYKKDTLRNVFRNFLFSLFVIKNQEEFIKKIEKKKDLKEFISKISSISEIKLEYTEAIIRALYEKTSYTS